MYQSIPKLDSIKWRMQTWRQTIVFRVSGTIFVSFWLRGENNGLQQSVVYILYWPILKPPMFPPGKTLGIWLFWKILVKFPGSLDGRMPHQLALQKASKTPTHQRLFKHFPMYQTVYSNLNILLNRTQISNQVSESCLPEVCSFQLNCSFLKDHI